MTDLKIRRQYSQNQRVTSVVTVKRLQEVRRCLSFAVIVGEGKHLLSKLSGRCRLSACLDGMWKKSTLVRRRA